MGKNVEEESKGLGCFKSGVSVEVYFRELRNQLKKKIFGSLGFLRSHGRREIHFRGRGREREGCLL